MKQRQSMLSVHIAIVVNFQMVKLVRIVGAIMQRRLLERYKYMLKMTKINVILQNLNLTIN